MIFNLSHCELFSKHVTAATSGNELRHTGSNSSVSITFARSLYDLRDVLPAALAELRGRGIWMTITHVVYNRGSWDLLYMDKPPEQIREEAESSLKMLGDQLPQDCEIIVYPTHFTQRYTRRKHERYHPWKRNIRNVCMSDTRTDNVRAAAFCAVGHVTENRSRAISIFARESQSTIAPSMTDFGGHHYHDILLEAMMMKLLTHHVCPKQRRYHVERTDTTTKACAHSIQTSAHFNARPSCRCHDLDVTLGIWAAAQFWFRKQELSKGTNPTD